MPRILLFCAIVSMAARLPAANGDEALWRGFDSYRAGDYGAARSLLARASDNPYIEIFRLYYRAECLLRDSLYQNAAAEIETLFTLVNSGTIDANHGFVARARDLYIEARAGAGLCVFDMPAGVSSLIPAGIGDPSSRAWLMAARACLDQGDGARAIKYCASGATANPIGADASIFKDVFNRCASRLSECSDRALLAIAARAVDYALFSEAKAAVDHMIAWKPQDPDALLEHANVTFESGEPERALRAYWRIFYSAAPVRAKASALLRISSIEYYLKRYEKAAKYYRMYGMFYPREGSAPQALDTAARIHVMGGEWRKALDVWTILRERHRDGDRIEAGLSEAVLRFWLGESAKAHGILHEILPRSRRSQRAAVLFWLMKTSSADDERAEWAGSLIRDWPRSFYASIARGENGALTLERRESEAREMDAFARYAKDRRAGYERAEADSARMRHPAFRAYVDLLDHGCVEEAGATAHAMIRIPNLPRRAHDRGEAEGGVSAAGVDADPGRLFMLYAEAAKHGCEALSLSLLSRTSPTDSSGFFPAELWYPVSYVDEIQAGAEAAGLSPFLVLAIIREESRFDPNVVSAAGAVGLMQLLPHTAMWRSSLTDTMPMGADDLREPAKNIRAGTAYFRYLLDRFDGSAIGAIAAYNGGEGRMAAWRKNFKPERNPLVALELIGPRETRRYVKKVLDAHSAYVATAREKAPTK